MSTVKEIIMSTEAALREDLAKIVNSHITSFEDFEKLLDKMIEEERGMRATKGKDYTVGDDRLNNFREIAEDMTAAGFPIGMKQVIWIYFYKHIQSIRRYVCTGKISSEPIEGRILDARVYLSLLRAVVEEEKNNDTKIE